MSDRTKMDSMFRPRTRRRAGEGRRKPRHTKGEVRREVTGSSNSRISRYEQGPFPAVEVPEFPPFLLQLLERATGRGVDLEALRKYERCRAFVGYTGVQMDGRLKAAQSLEAPEEKLVSAPNSESRPNPGRWPAGKIPPGVDPFDLGDE